MRSQIFRLGGIYVGSKYLNMSNLDYVCTEMLIFLKIRSSANYNHVHHMKSYSCNNHVNYYNFRFLHKILVAK